MSGLEGFTESFTKSLADIDFTADPEALKSSLIELASGNANTAAEGLLNKNKELIQKGTNRNDVNHAQSEKMKELETYFDNAELGKLELGKQYDEGKVLYQANSDKKVTSANERADSLESQLRGLLVDNGVAAELVALDVSKDLMPMVQIAIATKATIVDGKAMIGEQTLSEYMKDWAETPTGKAARVAPNNSGGDALGGDKAKQQISGKDKAWKDKTIQEKTAFLEAKG